MCAKWWVGGQRRKRRGGGEKRRKENMKNKNKQKEGVGWWFSLGLGPGRSAVCPIYLFKTAPSLRRATPYASEYLSLTVRLSLS